MQHCNSNAGLSANMQPALLSTGPLYDITKVSLRAVAERERIPSRSCFEKPPQFPAAGPSSPTQDRPLPTQDWTGHPLSRRSSGSLGALIGALSDGSSAGLLPTEVTPRFWVAGTSTHRPVSSQTEREEDLVSPLATPAREDGLSLLVRERRSCLVSMEWRKRGSPPVIEVLAAQ